MLVVLLMVHLHLGAQVVGADDAPAAAAPSQASPSQASPSSSASSSSPGVSPGRRVGGGAPMLRSSSTSTCWSTRRTGWITGCARSRRRCPNRRRSGGRSFTDLGLRPPLQLLVPPTSSQPLPFALLDEEIPRANLTDDEFQVYNYMRPEPGAVKDAFVEADLNRHLYFKSAFIMNHPAGGWKFAQRQIQRLTPVDRIAEMLQANKKMVGLHVRNVFDAPRDAQTNTSVTGAAAVEGAQKEYGAEGARQLMMWRKASHWTNFVPRMIALLRENSFRNPLGLAQEPLQFYLAADSEDAYTGLTKRFPNRIKFQQRDCASERCDFRDCEGMIYSIVDMLNLGRTKLILGSGWSSYSEVAAYIGGAQGQPVPILMAGRDFGVVVDDKKKPSRNVPQPACCNELMEHAAGSLDFTENMGLEKVRSGGEEDEKTIQRFWPAPFAGFGA